MCIQFQKYDTKTPPEEYPYLQHDQSQEVLKT